MLENDGRIRRPLAPQATGRHQAPAQAQTSTRSSMPATASSRTEHGPRRRGVLVGAGILGALAVGGCGSAVPGGGDESPTSVADGGDDTTGKAVSRTLLERFPDRASSVPEVAGVDLSGLEGGVAVTFPRLPRARGLSEAVDIAVTKILREHHYAGDAAGKITVTSRIAVTGADVIGVLMMHGDANGNYPLSLFYRADGDRAFTSPGLVAPEQWPALEKAVAAAAKEVDGLDAGSLATALQEQPRPWANGPTMIPMDDGSLMTVFPAATVDGKPAVVELALDAKTAAPLLSEDGKAVAAAVAQTAAFDPAKVAVPGAGSTRGDKNYAQPNPVLEPSPARASDGVGPVAQLAPRSGAGVRPSSVAAPDASRLNALCISFDDGPSPELNQKLRDALTHAHAASTLFMIGQSVAAAKGLCTKSALEGLEIGSHSWSHPQLSKLSGQKLADEVSKPTDVIAECTGRPPFVMRPPYGARNDETDAAVGALGQSSQIWDIDTLDWKTHSVPQNIESARTGRRGSIILMHEIHAASVDSVPAILDNFAADGYTLLTASELGQNQMRAGMHYMRGLVTDHGVPAPPAPTAPAGASDGGL